MARPTLTVDVVTVKPFKEDMFEDFLSIDGDFVENENYFREDTIEKGFRNEAHRISKKYSKKFTNKWNKNEEHQDDEYFERLINEFLEKLANVYAGNNQFILGNQTYTSDYVITSVSDFRNYDEEITVIVSYIG